MSIFLYSGGSALTSFCRPRTDLDGVASSRRLTAAASNRTIAMQIHERLHETLIRARANGKHCCFLAALRHVGMAHRAIHVDRLARFQHHGVVEIRVNRDRAFEHVDVFLSRVTHKLTKLLEALAPN